MTAQPIARGLATRTANKNKRRDHILSCAGEMISEVGLDGLTLANLAERAGVTIPTVHNLLGKKADLLAHLVTDCMERVMEAGTARDLTNPITAVETFASGLIGLLQTDEALFRGAFIAGERMKFFEHQSEEGIISRSIEESRLVCRQAVERRELEGRIDPSELGTRLFASQRLARQDWMNGYIDLSTYQRELMIGMFVTLCADAAPAFKDRLIDKISALKATS